SVVIMWCGRTCASSWNQNADTCVRTRPLWGIPSFITTSKADTRSLATSNRSSPISKMSRTLPRLLRVRPSSETSMSGVVKLPLPGGSVKFVGRIEEVDSAPQRSRPRRPLCVLGRRGARALGACSSLLFEVLDGEPQDEGDHDDAQI